MLSVARVVEHIVEDKPFIQEALARGIINYGAMAEEMLSLIEAELKKKVKHAAVMMALRRTAEKLEKKFECKQPFEKAKDLTIVSNLFILTLSKTPETVESIKDAYKLVDFGEDVLTVTEGIHEISIMSNNKYFNDIKKLFGKHYAKNLRAAEKNVASLTITIPKEAIPVPGFFFLVTRALAWENISVIEVVSTNSELTLILAEQDVTRAYNVLRAK
jgi:hypothetical protein